eukprot:1149236-Pelagomonas_calceolata.AAC.2
MSSLTCVPYFAYYPHQNIESRLWGNTCSTCKKIHFLRCELPATASSKEAGMMHKLNNTGQCANLSICQDVSTLACKKGSLGPSRTKRQRATGLCSHSPKQASLLRTVVKWKCTVHSWHNFARVC